MKMPLSVHYVAYKKGILSHEKFRKQYHEGLFLTAITSVGTVIIWSAIPPLGAATFALTATMLGLDEYLAHREYATQEDAIAEEDIERIDVQTNTIRLKGDRIITVPPEQIEALLEVNKISHLPYEIT